MILRGDSGDGLDQADSALRSVQSELDRILASPSGMSDLDRITLKKVADDVSGSSIELLTLLESLPDRDKARQIAEYISSVVISAMIAGAASVFTPDAKLWFDTGKGHKASAGNKKKAEAKNQKMWPHIRAEAEAKGRNLADSEELARLIEPGVRSRMNVDGDQRGYSPATIRRQIRFILAEC